MKKILAGIFVLLFGAFYLAGNAYAAGKPFPIDLFGANEIPGPGDPDGWGSAHMTLNQGAGEVCFELQAADILLPATGAHIHYAPAGVSGPVVVALTPPDENGSSVGCVSVDNELVKEIRKNASEYYVNVHNVDYPAGALRGQLE